LEQNSIIASNTYSLLDNLLQWSLLQTNGGYFIQDEYRLSLLIDQVVYDYRGQLSQNSIEFVNEVPRAIRVWVDEESVKLILRNLMDNSIKFSKESGKISTYVQDETDKAVTLVWEDEGEGMSQETSNKLLTAKRLDRKEHEHTIGAGLGM
jgi:K+-sensing histidine kinase KdpD